MVDGNTSTSWFLKDKNLKLYFDLGEVKKVAHMEFVWGYNKNDPNRTYDMDVYTSKDSIKWEKVNWFRGQTKDFNRAPIYIAQEAQYIRIDNTKDSFISIHEVEVFEADITDQTISFDSIADKQNSDSDFDLVASATSGLDVSFKVVSGPATISGKKVSLTGGVGTVVIEAYQEGDTSYNEAPSIMRSFDVNGIVTNVVSITQPKEVKVWPVPATDKINFMISTPSFIQLISLTGKVLHSGYYGEGKHQIDISSLRSGSFILKSNDSIHSILKY